MSWLWPLCLFSFVTSITPGPNNAMLLASGMRFGLVRSLPHLLGVTVGFAALLVLCGLGVGRAMLASPTASLVLKIVGSAYLLYLAWSLRRIAVPRPASPEDAAPWSLPQAALFQFANPKGWMMAVSASGTLMPDLGNLALSVAVLTVVFAGINLPCIGAWALLGSGIGALLERRGASTAFSVIMIAMLLATVVAIWC